VAHLSACATQAWLARYHEATFCKTSRLLFTSTVFGNNGDCTWLHPADTSRVSQKTTWLFSASGSASDAYIHNVYQEICIDCKQLDRYPTCTVSYGCPCLLDDAVIVSNGSTSRSTKQPHRFLRDPCMHVTHRLISLVGNKLLGHQSTIVELETLKALAWCYVYTTSWLLTGHLAFVICTKTLNDVDSRTISFS